jgi:hypothetical protein
MLCSQFAHFAQRFPMKQDLAPGKENSSNSKCEEQGICGDTAVAKFYMNIQQNT